MAESAEGTRLLSEYGAKVPSRVRIPVSPPLVIKPEFHTRVFYCAANRLQAFSKIVANALRVVPLTADGEGL
jgi:hypothetical protein